MAAKTLPPRRPRKAVLTVLAVLGTALVYLLCMPSWPRSAELAQWDAEYPPPRRRGAHGNAGGGGGGRAGGGVRAPSNGTTHVALRITDPRFDGYVVGIKSGKDVIADHVPHLLATSLRGVRHIHLIGDSSEISLGELTMENVVEDIFGETKRVLRKYGMWERANTPLRHPKSENIALPPPPRRLHRRSDGDKEQIRSDNRQGWRLDAHKFLPSVRAMRRRFPGADWYILLDDDTYLLMENLHFHLSNMDPAEPLYFGSGTVFMGCDGVTMFGDGPQFAHGGAGIVMSRGAVDRVLSQPAALEDCVWRYRDCWAGDIRLGLCMRDHGVPLTPQPFGDNGFNVGTPHWSVNPYDDKPCRRPVSFHHLTGAAMIKIFAAERRAQQMAAQLSVRQIGRLSPRTHPHLYPVAPGSKPPVPSTFYAPVNQEDLWDLFVDKDPDLPDEERGKARGGAAIGDARQVESSAECRQLCVDLDRCAAWDYFTKKKLCRLMAGVSVAVDNANAVTGIIKGRFKCHHRTL